MSRDLSLTQQAYVRLREDLLACRLQPGERLNIKELSVHLGVSLGAVREALSRLTSEGFVVAEDKRGFRAAPISEEDLHDLSRVRTVIEGLCLRRAVELADVAWESGMVAALHRLSRTPQNVPEDPARLNDDWAAAHAAFHRALAAGCDSPWLLRVRELLYAQSERYRYLAVPLGREHRDEKHLMREHESIVKAALEHDADKAVALLAGHLETTARQLSGGRRAELGAEKRRARGRA